MNKLFILAGLLSATTVFANQYYENGQGSYPSYNGNGCYQGQPNNGNYYQDYNQNQGQRPYQGNNNQYQGNNQSYQQQNDRSYGNNQQMARNDDSGYSRNDNQGSVSDQRIGKEVNDALGAGWFSKGFQDIKFDVNNGVVNLRGSVDTLENKKKVEATVREINGVKQVNNQLTIAGSNSSPYSDSQLQDSEKKYPQDTAINYQDRQLNAKIRNELNGGWFSKGNTTLVLKTANGVVVMTGNVDRVEDIQKLTDQVKNIEGVQGVNAQLTVVK